MPTLQEQIAKKVSREARGVQARRRRENRPAPNLARKQQEAEGRRLRENILRPSRRRPQMIKLETAHIEEVRGIRKLDINLQKVIAQPPADFA